MTFTQIMAYVFVMFLIAVTLYNLYAMLTARSRKKFATSSYAAEMNKIEKKLLGDMKSRGLEFDKVDRFMNDKAEGIICCYDTKRKVFAVAMSGDTLLEKAECLEGVRKEYVQKGRKTLSSAVILTVSGTECTYPIGTKPFRPWGVIGKVVYDTTEEFYSFMLGVKEGTLGA